MAVAAYAGVQRSGFAELLGLGRLELRGEEAWLIPSTLLSTSLIALLPALFVAVVLQRCARPRASRIAFLALSSSALFLLLLDLDLLCSFGRHLSEVVRVAREPQGHVAGG